LATLLAGCEASGSHSVATAAPSNPTAPPSVPTPEAPPVAASASATTSGPASASAAPSEQASAAAPPTPAPPRAATASAAAPPKPAPKPLPADAGVVLDAGRAATDAGVATSPGKAVALAVDAIFAASKTYTAQFDQQYTAKITGIVKDSSGVLYMQRPDKISFRYNPPNNSRIVADGTTIKIYTPQDNQMIVQPMQKTQYPGALAFMMGNGIASSFDFAVRDRIPYAGTVLEGKPLVANPSYETVTFFVGKTALAARDPGVLERVIVVDAQGNKNRFDFKNASQPASISPPEFTFTPPPGTTIVP
jgi:outer membrane lipoprotein carrier protein